MKINYKLFTLPIMVLISLVYISFLFSSEIERLKDKIDIDRKHQKQRSNIAYQTQVVTLVIMAIQIVLIVFLILSKKGD